VACWAALQMNAAQRLGTTLNIQNIGGDMLPCGWLTCSPWVYDMFPMGGASVIAGLTRNPLKQRRPLVGGLRVRPAMTKQEAASQNNISPVFGCSMG